MAEYYLISQLPSLDGIGETMNLPITEERFLELCHSFLSKDAQSELDKLSLIPTRSPEKSSSDLIEAWNEAERSLRLVLAKLRAEKKQKAFDSENAEGKFLPNALIQAAHNAVESDNPLEAEKILNDYRLEFLESLRPMDSFSQDYVFYYLLKLRLLSRARAFNTESGEAAYRNIYNSVMNGDRLEAVQ